MFNMSPRTTQRHLMKQEAGNLLDDLSSSYIESKIK